MQAEAKNCPQEYRVFYTKGYFRRWCCGGADNTRKYKREPKSPFFARSTWQVSMKRDQTANSHGLLKYKGKDVCGISLTLERVLFNRPDA